MIDIMTMKHFKPEAKVKSHHITLAEPSNILQQVARVLLQHAGKNNTRRSGLSQREIATMLGISWDMVNSSLKSLQAEGAIRIERHQIVINKKALEQIAMERVQVS
jgi:DNA-binding GntR family transcriptional regulator